MEFFEFDNSFLSKDGYGGKHSALKNKDSIGSIITNSGSSFGTVTCAESEYYKANNAKPVIKKDSYGGTISTQVSCINNMPFETTGNGGGPLAPPNKGGNFSNKGVKF